MQVGESDIGLLLQSLLYRQLGDQDLFLCGDGQFRSLSSGYLLDTSGMDMQVWSLTVCVCRASSLTWCSCC